VISARETKSTRHPLPPPAQKQKGRR
jgi:hypothetical protein